MGDETLTAAAGICVTVPKALAHLATAPILPGSPLRNSISPTRPVGALSSRCALDHQVYVVLRCA
jgi:hypothetical protein